MISIIDDTTETLSNFQLPIGNLKLSDKIKEGEIIEDENAKEGDPYKFIQRVGDDIIKRNNADPTLTPDGLPTVETQLQKIQELDEQNYLDRPRGVDNLIKLRCVVMNIIGLSPLTDTRFMSQPVKNQYIKSRDTYVIDLTQDKLDEDFNKVCHETIFENGEDVSRYPVFL
jgi:hypothetical protein